MPERLRIQPIPFSGAIGDDAILGVSVATTGEALGHRLLFDDHSLFQLQQIAEGKANGIKSRFTHPDPFNDGLGKYLGRFRNFRVDNHKLVADLFISRAAHKSPAGDLGQYVLELAREDPGAFGVSVVVDLERVWPTADGNEVPASGGRPASATDKYPVARITSLYAADIVDEPALNPDGLFQITDEDIKALFTDEEFTRLMKEGDDKDMEDNLLFKISELESQVATLTRKLEDGV
ncbi:MAG: hypothetical protein FIA98_12835, partial [Anaerolineae bacterium]|nr:hypothetical protein [Anaerolineae bacterium]